MKELAGQTAGVLSAIAMIAYMLATLFGDTKPRRATWWIWTVACTMLAASHYDPEGSNDSIWVPLTYVIGPGIIALISIWYGEGGWEKSDKICIAASLISILIWIFTDRWAALTINIVVDGFGAYLTVQSVKEKPEKENKWTWSLALAANIVNLIAIEKFTYTETAYPVYLVIMVGTITVLSWRKPKTLLA